MESSEVLKVATSPLLRDHGKAAYPRLICRVLGEVTRLRVDCWATYATHNTTVVKANAVARRSPLIAGKWHATCESHAALNGSASGGQQRVSRSPLRMKHRSCKGEASKDGPDRRFGGDIQDGIASNQATLTAHAELNIRSIGMICDHLIEMPSMSLLVASVDLAPFLQLRE